MNVFPSGEGFSIDHVLKNPAIAKLLEKEGKKKQKKIQKKKPGKKTAVNEKFVVPDREPVDPNWFQEFIIKNEEEAVNTEEARAMKIKAERIDNAAEKLLNTEIERLSYKDYEDLLEEEEVREKVAMQLMKHKKLHKTNIKELATALKQTDKDIFDKLRKGGLSQDQLKSRIAERRQGLKYLVLDDIADEFGFEFTCLKEGNDKKDSDQDKKRVVKNKSAVFLNRGREDPIRNYLL